jgi:hypothetical protein
MKLSILQQKMAGHEFTVAEIILNPWTRDDNIIQLCLMTQWCDNTFGPPCSVWGLSHSQLGRWYYNNSRLWFRDPTDATMFAMRWA